MDRTKINDFECPLWARELLACCSFGVCFQEDSLNNITNVFDECYNTFSELMSVSIMATVLLFPYEELVFYVFV